MFWRTLGPIIAQPSNELSSTKLSMPAPAISLCATNFHHSMRSELAPNNGANQGFPVSASGVVTKLPVIQLKTAELAADLGKFARRGLRQLS